MNARVEDEHGQREKLGKYIMHHVKDMYNTNGKVLGFDVNDAKFANYMREKAKPWVKRIFDDK